MSNNEDVIIELQRVYAFLTQRANERNEYLNDAFREGLVNGYLNAADKIYEVIERIKE